MQATLKFNLPEEREDHENALKGGTYKATIEEALDLIRSKTKYTELTENEHFLLNEIREVLLDCGV